MTTAQEVSQASSQPIKPDLRPPRRASRFVARAAALLLAVGLGAWNVWWFIREGRPVPDLETAQRAIGRGDYREGERLLRERLRRRPRDATVMTALARARAGQNDLLGCARMLLQVPEWSSQKAEALYRAGQSLYQIDHAREAEAAWLELTHEDPLHPVPNELFLDASMELLKLYAVEDRWPDAYPVIWAAHDRTQGADQVGWLMSRMRPELERVAHTQAIPPLKRFLAADPADLEARRALARAELAIGSRPEAEAQFQECRKRAPDQVRVWRDSLSMLLEQGDYDQFVALLDQPPKDADLEPETWFFRGTVAEKKGAWAEAEGHFKKAIELHPFTPKYYYRLAAVEDRLGERSQAAAHRKRTQRMNDARSQLPGAYNAFLAAQAGDAGAKPADRAPAARRLGSICETLGWARAAQAWNRLAVAL